MTSRDVMAAVPFLCFGCLVLFAWLAYQEVGHWPVYGTPDPKEVGFEIVPGVRVGAVLRFLVPVLTAPLSVVAVVAIVLATASDMMDSSRSSRPPIMRRGLWQFGASLVGLILFWHLLGTLLEWLID